MPEKGHSEEQIVAVLRQVEGGERAADICRKVGISQATYLLVEEAVRRVGGERTPRAAAAARGERGA